MSTSFNNDHVSSICWNISWQFSEMFRMFSATVALCQQICNVLFLSVYHTLFIKVWNTSPFVSNFIYCQRLFTYPLILNCWQDNTVNNTTGFCSIYYVSSLCLSWPTNRTQRGRHLVLYFWRQTLQKKTSANATSFKLSALLHFVLIYNSVVKKLWNSWYTLHGVVCLSIVYIVHILVSLFLSKT